MIGWSLCFEIVSKVGRGYSSLDVVYTPNQVFAYVRNFENI